MSGRRMLALYPRRWRERYGEELSDLMASQPASLALVLDVLAGAIDARVFREYPVVEMSDEMEGTKMSSLFAASAAENRPAYDFLAPMGVLIAYVAVWLTSKALWGDRPATEAFMYAGLGAICMTAYAIQALRLHSHAAKAGLMTVALAIFYGISLLATWMAHQI